MVAPNKNRTSLINMVKDANLDKMMNGPMASLLEGPLQREPTAYESCSKRAKIVQRGAEVFTGVLEHGHASSVSSQAKFVANDRHTTLHILAKGIEPHSKKQGPIIAGVKTPIRMESTSTRAFVDRARVSSSRPEKSNVGLEVINLSDDDGEDAGLVDHYPAQPNTQNIECDKMKDKSSMSNLLSMSATNILKEEVVFVGDKTSLPAFKKSTPTVVVMIRDSGWELNSHYHHLHKLNLELNSLDAETACLIMSQCGVATPSVLDMANV
ncbi:unnamed protein product [Sphagnum jensenii]